MDRHGDCLGKPSGWRVRQCELSAIAQNDFARDGKTKTGSSGGTDGIGAKEWLHRALEQVIGYAVSTIEDFDPRDRSGVEQRNRGALTMSGRIDKEVSQRPFERQRPDHDLSRCYAAEAQVHAEFAKLGHDLAEKKIKSDRILLLHGRFFAHQAYGTVGDMVHLIEIGQPFLPV